MRYFIQYNALSFFVACIDLYEDLCGLRAVVAKNLNLFYAVIENVEKIKKML